jgi:signal transduction histidine kinase
LSAIPSILKAGMGASRAWVGWLPLSAFAAVVAAGAAGLWGISVARRGAVEGAALAFEREVGQRARALEFRLAAVRGDLLFLANSAPLSRVDYEEPSIEEWRRVGAESAVLLFLRGNPEVVRVAALSPRGAAVFHAGRRGGVPLLWVASRPTGLEGVALAPGRPRLLARVPWRPDLESEGGSPALEIEVEPAELLPPLESSYDCRLLDSAGSLVGSVETPVPSGGARVRGEAAVEAEGWSAPSPLRLECDQPESAAMALVEPLVRRYRATLAVDLVLMALTLVLGFSAVQESRRRERIEARSREEARTRVLEQQLFHAERLTTVGRLAAGMAHEINNPLEGMSNWLSLARQDLALGRVEEAEGHLARVKEGLDRAAGIVRQVLAHAEPSNSAQSVVDLHQVIGDASRLVQSRKEFQRIEFALELGSTPLLVRGNAVMLGQVALNLILNACEMQPGGGEVRVRSRQDEGRVVAEFADRGPGVPEADRERIFEPFFTTKSSTGLGLSISHSIVRQHQGELAFVPREGGGSVFRLTLPAAP